jgi:hypothetical protein
LFTAGRVAHGLALRLSLRAAVANVSGVNGIHIARAQIATGMWQGTKSVRRIKGTSLIHRCRASAGARTARPTKKDGKNVSHVINLGELYCDLGMPKEALGSFLGTDMSPYGRMQETYVRLDAAVQQGDTEQVNRWLAVNGNLKLTHRGSVLLCR